MFFVVTNKSMLGGFFVEINKCVHTIIRDSRVAETFFSRYTVKVIRNIKIKLKGHLHAEPL